MIVNFHIQNFGSVKEKQTLSFEATSSTDLEDYYVFKTHEGQRLLKLGLIYGANASGKTTILRALDFLRELVLDPAEKKTDEFHFKPFLFDPHTPNENTILAIEFVQNQVRYFYEVEFNFRAILKEELIYYKPNKATVFKRTTDVKKQFTEISFGSKIKKDKTFEKNLEANTLWNNTVLGGFLKTNIELFELKEVTDWFYNYLSSMIFTKSELDNYITDRIEKSEINKSTVVEILKKADFNISNILINEEEKDIPNDFLEFLEKQAKDDKSRETISEIKKKGKFTSVNLEFEHTINELKYRLPFELQSQGTQRYYGFAGLLSILIKNSEMLPIDELEASLHPDLYIHFLLSFLINSKNSQILATTHNREILSNKDIFRNDAIWFTDKNTFSATELYSLADFDSKVIRDTSNVLNAYKVGKLGGIPQLGDYYIDASNEAD